MDKEEGAEGEESDEEDAGEDVDVEGEDEEDSDLDLAWKMLESAIVFWINRKILSKKWML